MFLYKTSKWIAMAFACLIANAAIAGTVQYSTSGIFSASGTSKIDVPNSLTPTSTLKYISQGPTVVNTIDGVDKTIDLGSFVLTTTSIAGDSFLGKFTLSLGQVIPSIGTGTAQGSVSGTIFTTDGSVKIAFAGAGSGSGDNDFFSISSPYGPVAYTVDAKVILGPGSSSILFKGTVNTPAGTPVVAPAPVSSTAGVALIAMMGLPKLRRRFTMA